MEHLHFDGIRHLDPLPLRYFGGLVEFDGQDFHTFLDRIGAEESELLMMTVMPEVTGKTDVALANCIIQEWLFFGVLHAFFAAFGVRVVRRDFIELRDGDTFVTTRSLPALAVRLFDHQTDALLRTDNQHGQSYYRHVLDGQARRDPVAARRALEAYVNDLKAQDLPDREKAIKRFEPPAARARTGAKVWDCLKHAQRFLRGMHDITRKSYLPMLTDLNLYLSVQMLLESLGFLALRFSKDNHRMDVIGVEMFPIWTQRAHDAGQCPRRIDVVFAGSVSQKYFATSLRTESTLDHSNCSAKQCNANSVDIENDLPHHHKDCDGTCEAIGLSESNLSRMKHLLEEGTFGILRFVEDSEGKLSIQVVNARDGVAYTALSHVWSHGLGNPKENALYRCQLDSIRQCLKSSPDLPQCLWLDTLCVPLANPHRRLAIVQMRNIYRAATKVLVRDNSLLQIGNHPLEQAFGVLICDWMHRLWTLNESVLADERLVIGFKTDFKSIKQLIAEVGASVTAQHLLFDNAAFAYLTSAGLLFGRESRILDLAGSLHARTTAKPQDEPLCLAMMMGLDLSKLPEPAKLADVLRALDYLPQNLLFAPGPRMTIKGFRWAPQSFLAQDSTAYSARQQQAKLTEEGFCVQRDSVVFKISARFWFDPVKADGRPEIFKFGVIDKQGQHWRYFVVTEWSRSIPGQTKARWIEWPGLVFQKSIARNVEYGRTIVGSAAVLVGSVSDRKGTYHGHYEALVATFDAVDFESMNDASKACILDVAGAEEANSKWCID